MQLHITYKGILNGIHGFWGENHPAELIIEEEIPVYYPDEGKVFKKDDEYFYSVILQEGEKIEDYEEVDIPPEPEEELSEEPTESTESGKPEDTEKDEQKEEGAKDAE